MLPSLLTSAPVPGVRECPATSDHVFHALMECAGGGNAVSESVRQRPKVRLRQTMAAKLGVYEPLFGMAWTRSTEKCFAALSL